MVPQEGFEPPTPSLRLRSPISTKSFMRTGISVSATIKPSSKGTFVDTPSFSGYIRGQPRRTGSADTARTQRGVMRLNEDTIKRLPIPDAGNRVTYFGGATLQGAQAPRGFGVRVTES